MKSNHQSGESIPQTLTSAQASYWLGKHEVTIRRACIAGKYLGAIKRADGWAIPLTALPVTVQQQYMEAQYPAQIAAPPAILPALVDKPLLVADALHLAYRRAPTKSKERADKLAAAVADFADLHAAGASKGNAAAQIKAAYQIDNATLWRARLQIEGQPRELWAALLLPRYKGRTKEAELTPDAWDWIKSHYLNTSETPACVIIKEAKKEGRARGWIFPSEKTITRKINSLPATQYLLGRKGMEAFDATFPAAERDYLSYSLHNTWVSDGRNFDVFCLWPDGTIDRPFLVAWVEMRTRKILGVRGGIHPNAALTLAAFRSALENTQIKPQRALLDNGREYAAKAVTGGQKTRYRFQIKEDDPIGALTRMGIVADWARPYRGQEKPIESFWKWVAYRFDQLPMFQGAYCGKDTASKPSDFDAQKNAIPIEIFSGKLAEILDGFNCEHKHRGRGMNGKPPQQVYEELIQAEPLKEWPRPSAEDMRLLQLEQRVLTLNNKDASIRFKILGYGEARFWSETLADLPMAARAKKYHIFHNSALPDSPVLVYDDMRFICEASRIGLIGSKEAAAQHCINKAAFKKPRAAGFKALKKAAPVCLHAPAAPVFAVPVVVEKPAALVALPIPAPLVETSPGVFTDTATGESFGTPKAEKPADTQAAEAEKYRLIAQRREAARLEKRFKAA